MQRCRVVLQPISNAWANRKKKRELWPERDAKQWPWLSFFSPFETRKEKKGGGRCYRNEKAGYTYKTCFILIFVFFLLLVPIVQNIQNCLSVWFSSVPFRPVCVRKISFRPHPRGCNRITKKNGDSRDLCRDVSRCPSDGLIGRPNERTFPLFLKGFGLWCRRAAVTSLFFFGFQVFKCLFVFCTPKWKCEALKNKPIVGYILVAYIQLGVCQLFGFGVSNSPSSLHKKKKRTRETLSLSCCVLRGGCYTRPAVSSLRVTGFLCVVCVCVS